ncbi:uncharacterized protein BDR25DRAFT_235678, partial [Lindgomyces ingoldianus]
PTHVTVEIGSGGTRYFIFKPFLVHYSEYFRNTLARHQKEAFGAPESMTPGLSRSMCLSNDCKLRGFPKPRKNGWRCPRVDTTLHRDSSGDMCKMKKYVLADRRKALMFRKAIYNSIAGDKNRLTNGTILRRSHLRLQLPAFRPSTP